MATKTIERDAGATAQAVFAQVGAFLTAHRLSPDPRNYTIGYEVVANPSGVTAREVAVLTDGGVRLSADDIAKLGGVALPGGENALKEERALLDRAMSQMEGFAHTVDIVFAETSDFGRDLQRSADTMRDAGPLAGMAEIEELTAAMIERVARAEQRLDHARRESDELRHALEEARGNALTDPLTELGNRRAFDHAFNALAPDAAVAMVICDVDHFKRVNDNYGHAVGDRVLRTVARTLMEECGGLATRYGGEEFAVLYEGISAEEAKARIDHVRENLAGRRFRVRETDQPLGVIDFSAGVVQGVVDEGRASLMARADAALYRAKGEGRGRTIIAP
ncbi:hypothetical protein ASG29_02830 [Sphingomonas sp. Leaf412]|uniref:GGDEF domain-containing protein n=1 Tax=Sphingomonas sp. Leaf412 TaxID=1736370 RepID=UPI0006FF66CF|nr:GGDEF domain-containing protein [Sphingomonas sp. Leaf412]KQT35078.1 hypothetical protein ASG29_02830 [Sphingomonas sp. Leaf412]